MSEFIDLKEALEITVELARENVLEERQCDDEGMLADRAKQQAAVDRVQSYVDSIIGCVGS